MDNNQLPWPKKGEKLFKDTGEYYQHSHFAWGDFWTQFSGYTAGYKDSADALIEKAIDSKDISKLDTFVFPICFLYRQYLELEMKVLYLNYSEDTPDEKRKTIRTVNHNLWKIWKKIKNILIENSDETGFNTIEVVEDYIIQFHKLDETSYTFRYPIDKNLNLYFDSQKRLDLLNLKTRMDELQSFFDGCEGALWEIKKFKYDISKYFNE